MVIERAFGQLVARWRFLRNYVYLMSPIRISRTIIVCCILHNICLNMQDAHNVRIFDNVRGDEDRVETLPLPSAGARQRQRAQHNAGAHKGDELAAQINALYNRQ